MASFEIYPAIDLMNGEVVRLKQGDPDRKTIYGTDPAAAATRWQAAGAAWLHVVNLDGAFERQDANNLLALQKIVAAAGSSMSVQFGGGMRSHEDLDAAFNSGVSRAVLGTAAVEHPGFLRSVLDRYGLEKIAVGIDALGGKVRTRGWKHNGGMSVMQLGVEMMAFGVRTVIYTDIARDGMGTGVDWGGAVALAAIGFDVIASGGAASLEDVRTVHQQGLSGIIVGKALYDGRIDLKEALQMVKGSV